MNTVSHVDDQIHTNSWATVSLQVRNLVRKKYREQAIDNLTDIIDDVHQQVWDPVVKELKDELDEYPT